MAARRKKRTSKSARKSIEQYEHTDKQRANNPPVGLVKPETDPAGGRRSYAYDPHLDPQLVWAGKAEHTSFDVETVSLHVHERIDPKTILTAVRKDGKEAERGGSGEGAPRQMSFFEAPAENPPLRDALDFYRHPHGWSNRLVAGDSLLVMNSLLEKEGLAGKVQMVYIDPPYGIRYGSNFQPFVNRRDVKDGKDEDLTQEPEMIRAFRDTWELGIHSYLTYLRDRLLLARELLHESGSCFVQIGDENLHLLRSLLDEVFDKRSFVSQIAFTKAGGGLQSTSRLSSRLDYILWYAKDPGRFSYYPLFERRSIADAIAAGFGWIELSDGTRRRLHREERTGTSELPNGSELFMDVSLTKPGPGSKYEIEFDGKQFTSGRRWWGSPKPSLERLIALRRVISVGTDLRFVRYLNDFPAKTQDNLWDGLGGAANPTYVVQTNEEVVKRCILMSSQPGELEKIA